MKFNYNEYMDYDIPDGWCSEESGDNLFLYNPNGHGAITISFFNLKLQSGKSLNKNNSSCDVIKNGLYMVPSPSTAYTVNVKNNITIQTEKAQKNLFINVPLFYIFTSM